MTTNPSTKIRKATAEDVEQLAKLIDIAGEGIPTWLWAKTTNGTQTPLDVGKERARRTAGGFSYTNALVIENNERPGGMVLSYAIDEAPDDNPDDLPGPIAPFVELEKRSIGTWYINALAVFAEHRGLGLGTQLMKRVERLALDSGYEKMSIQVYAQNHGAVKLYKRLGYTQSASSPVRQHPCQPYYTGDVLLLIKELDASHRSRRLPFPQPI